MAEGKKKYDLLIGCRRMSDVGGGRGEGSIGTTPPKDINDLLPYLLLCVFTLLLLPSNLIT